MAEKQLRLSVHLEPTEALVTGINVLATPRPTLLEAMSEPELEKLAIARRAELRALDAGRRSLEEVDRLNFAGYLPRVDGFFSLSYANPNQRYFPQDEVWNLTWLIGVKASWTVNDTFRTIGASRASSSNIVALEEQRLALEDGIAVAVAAEAELTRTRMQRVNAHVDLLVAQAKLACAVGVDVLPQGPAEKGIGR